jgi:hypothetical protein
MIATQKQWPGLAAVRPLVRYVDESQAVIDTHIQIKPSVPVDHATTAIDAVEVMVEIDGDDGFHDEHQQVVPLKQMQGMIRLEVVRPDRWWPAGMGEQAMYRLHVHLMIGGHAIDSHVTSIGFTSVRNSEAGKSRELVINGRRYTVGVVMPIDAIHEHALLPVGGDSLLIVRDHYGPDLLYQAADRAGILMVQCVPIDPTGRPEQTMSEQVTRLAGHPSLVGWCVGHLGDLSHEIATRLHELDPTHAVFTDVPEEWAA